MKSLKWVNTLAFAAMVTVNALANLIPIGGNTTGEVSAAYPTLFTPAPITFSIWGLIYALLLLFVLYQWGKGGESLVYELGPWFAASCLMNIAWIFAWHLGAIELSLAYMAGLLISLIAIERSLPEKGRGWLYRLGAEAGFAIYLGWIIAATIANVSVVLVKLGWNGFGLSEQFWTVAVLLFGALLTVITVLRSGHWLTGAAVLWAYGGILLRHVGHSFLAGEYPVIIGTLIVCMICLAGTVLISLFSEQT